MTVLDCMLQNLPLLLAAVGLVVLGFIAAAGFIAADAVSGGAPVPFTTLLVEALATMWVPITLSVLTSVGLEWLICSDLLTAHQVVVATGAVVAVSTALVADGVVRFRRRWFDVVLTKR
jgi:putative effector of murein hydrolase LrgA (UPF0299 family)